MIRIFIVGYQRSGTTLLQSLLGAHDMLSTFSESHLFKKAFRTWRMYRPLYKRRGPITQKIEEFLQKNGLQALCESDAVRSLQAIDKRRWVRGIELAKAILSRRDMSISASQVTLEDMVREMLRPLLKEWLDRNLPYLIERLVKREMDIMVNRAERLE